MYGLEKGNVVVCRSCEEGNCENCQKYDLYLEKLRDNFRE